jgi:hypothetical protein
MKLHFPAIFLVLIILSGCTSEEHLKFLDVSINGTVDDFATGLINRGFTKEVSEEENQLKLNGLFIEEQSEVYLYYSGKSSTIYQVKVVIPTESRDSLKVSFEKIQKLCSSKYGIGKSRYYQFRNPERFFFNETRSIRKLTSGDFTRYTTAAGFITLKVNLESISITFTDKLNSEIQKRELELVGV